jgi:hypothetical protein
VRAAAGDTLRIMLPAFAQVCPFADECMYSPSLAFDARKQRLGRARPCQRLCPCVRLGVHRHSRFACFLPPVGSVRPGDRASATARSACCMPTGVVLRSESVVAVVARPHFGSGIGEAAARAVGHR